MNNSSPARQRGLSFIGFMMGCFILVFVSVIGLKLVPLYIEAGEIKEIFVVIASESEMSKAAPHEIREAFNKRASINNIKVISGTDIDISHDTGKLMLSAEYKVKVPLVANVSLILEFNPSSE